MSLISSIETDAKTVLTSIKSVFSSLKSELVSFLSKGASAVASSIEAQLPQAGADIVTFLEQSALAAVTAAEAIPGGGEAKMAAALVTFAGSLASKGITLIETEMRALLENALLIYKAAA